MEIIRVRIARYTSTRFKGKPHGYLWETYDIGVDIYRQYKHKNLI